MKKLLFYALLLVGLPGFHSPGNGNNWIVLPGSNLMVEGSTNINNFKCVIANYSSPDTVFISKLLHKGQSLPMSGKLLLDVQAFDCANKMMTNDLRKTLQSKTYPHLSIRFISINSFPDFKNPAKIAGVVDIGLAGVVKRFTINYLFTVDQLEGLHLTGDREITFSDFKLIPPSKLGGIIKAKDQLKVIFTLHLKPLS